MTQEEELKELEGKGHEQVRQRWEQRGKLQGCKGGEVMSMLVQQHSPKL